MQKVCIYVYVSCYKTNNENNIIEWNEHFVWWDLLLLFISTMIMHKNISSKHKCEFEIIPKMCLMYTFSDNIELIQFIMMFSILIDQVKKIIK